VYLKDYSPYLDSSLLCSESQNTIGVNLLGTTPYPPVQSQSSKSKYYSAKPIADWFDWSAEAPAMVGALVPPTPKIYNQHPYHDKDNFN